MSQPIMIVATEAGVGKSVVALGLLDQIQRQGARACYFKPVGLDDAPGRPGRDAGFIQHALKLPLAKDDLTAATSAEVLSALRTGNYDEVLDHILEVYERVSREHDVVVCEGVDSVRAFPALESDINVDIAKNINAPLLLVSSGADRNAEETAADVTLVCSELKERGAEMLGVVVNQVDLKRHSEFADNLRRSLRSTQIKLFGVMPRMPALANPRLIDVVRALGAEVISGEAYLETWIGPVLVAAMSLENSLHYFEDRSLIITPGDREEILLAAAAAYACDNTPRPSGVVLTGGFEPRRKVMALVRGLSQGRMPILRVDELTYATAVAVNDIQPALQEHQEDKVAVIRATVDEYLDFDQLSHSRVEGAESAETPRRFLRRLRDKARSDPQTIVLPESDVDRILQATEVIRQQNIAKIVLLGEEAKVQKSAAQLGLEFDADVSVVDPVTDSRFEEYVKTLVELRKQKNLTEMAARDLMRDRTYFGTMMVYKGRADGMVSGATTTTEATLRPGLQFIKTRPGFKNVSSVFFMCLPDRVLVYGDCAVIPKPTVEQLAEIALSSAETARAFGIEPRVAMLSYSTGSSGKGQDVEFVREATELVRQRNPQLSIEGPIQYDAAIDPGVARTKLPNSAVAGRATVFVFPDLNTGNNTYKAVQRSANAIAIGPVLQGLNMPVNDLSRGATVTDIVNTVMFTAIQAQSR
jgi:phosphate acetyltransferase